MGAAPPAPHLHGAAILVLALLATSSTASPAQCPPPLFPTVDVQCSYEGKDVPCVAPLQSGTRASFRCKPLHHFLFDYLPPAGYTAECRDDGEWSIRPFKCVPVCGQPTGNPTALIRNGEKVSSAAEYPWHVTIYDVRREPEQICGGSLISSKYFVSAAHCFFVRFKLRPTEDFRITVGKTRRSWSAPEDVNKQEADMKVIHVKEYGDRKLQYSNDIALVELKKEVLVNAYVLPVCVDWALKLPGLKDGELGTVVGYGQEANLANDELRFGKLPYIPLEKCKKNVTDNLAVFTHLPDKFCVGYRNDVTVAKGDSGGGLAFPDKERSWFLRGIVSVGSPLETTYSLFTNVTTFIPWMASIIQRGEVSGRRCGVDITQSEISVGANLDKKDFPWEMEVFHKKQSNRNFTRLWSGVLVAPTLVITSALLGSLDLTELPPTWLKVASLRDSQDISKAVHVSNVRRFHYPEDVLLLTGHVFLFVLLELETPLKLMPACMDWSGNALLRNFKQGATIIAKNATARSWRRYNIQSPQDCKGNKVKFLDDYNICVSSKERLRIADHSLSNSLMVSVDDTWYLRGILADLQEDGDQFTAVYTDFADMEVQQWLSKTKDVIGKPTCGKATLCQELYAGRSLRGHLPWNVQVVIESGSNTTTAGGVVVQSNAVLTDADEITVSDSNNKTQKATIDPTNVKVVWTDSEGNGHTVNVARIFVHESSVIDDGEVHWDIAVLELESEVNVMPVCLDLTGLVLQPLEPGQTGVVETWESWSSTQHTLTGAPYVTQLECLKVFYSNTPHSTSDISTSRDRFCSGPIQDKIKKGAPDVVLAGNYWYLRGISAGVVKKRAPFFFLSTDLRDNSIKIWLTTTLKMIEKKGSQRIRDEPPNANCVGGDHDMNECGRFSPFEDEGDNVPNFVSLEHMPWTVEVHVDRGEARWLERAGTLVRNDMVLTGSFSLVTGTVANISGDISTIPTSNVIVKWISADFKDRRLAEVLRIHAHERAHGDWRQTAWDLVLLELKSPLPLVPACLPRPVHQVPPLSDGQSGLLESWTSDVSVRAVLAVAFLSDAQCRQLLPNVTDREFTVDRFCLGPVTNNNFPLRVGTPFITVSGSAWFLRGVQCYNWGGSNANRPDLHAFSDLSNPDVVEWLERTMKGKFPVPTTTSSPFKASTTTERPTTPTSAAPTPAPPVETAPMKTTPTPITTTTPRRKSTAAPIPMLCGQFHNAKLPESSGSTEPGQMPWSVAVVVKGDNTTLKWQTGTLVRPNVVITDAYGFVTSNSWNDTGKVQSIPVDKLSVVSWTGEGGGRRRSSVRSLHVHERVFGDRADMAWNLAVLFLKSSFDVSVACLDLDGTLPALKTGDTGLIGSWIGDFYSNEHILTRSPYVAIEDCHLMVPNERPALFTKDRFCTGRINVTLWNGAGFVTKHASSNSWYVRGCKSFYWAAIPDLYAATNLDEPSLRDWLRELLEEADGLRASE